MDLPAELQKSFLLYVTHVDGEGRFLKISGQLDSQSSMMVDSLLDSARDNFDKGIGAVPPATIEDGTICAVKYCGTYYRAKIINTTNLSAGLVGVHFIDHGNKDIISLSAIRFLDIYDTMFLQLRGQATDFYLTRIMHPSGRWDEPLLLKLQTLLRLAEFPATIEGQTCTLPIISLQYEGNDFTTFLVSNRFGIAVSVAEQEVMMMQPTESESSGLNWERNLPSDSFLYAHHVPFNSAIVPPPSAISERLLVNNKATGGPVNFAGSIRRPQVALNSPPVHMVIPAPEALLQQSATYKNRLREVFVSFAEEGPELFAVQIVTDAWVLQDMTNDINMTPHSRLAEPPMIGTVCLGRMSRDKIICRAIIINISGMECKLYFVDFGGTEMVSYYDIFDIPEEFAKPHVFAVRYCLSGVEKLEKGPYLNEAFKQLVTGKVMMLRVVAPEGPALIQYGELYLDNKNVLDLLLANFKEKLQFKWMEMLPVGSRHSALVSYVDSCVKFYIQLSDKTDDLTTVMEAVKTHCEGTSSPGELPVGAACCARLPDNGEWYRAKVLGSDNKRTLVAYVDYGNERRVDGSDLRTITSELIELPVQAMKCALKGFENRPVESETLNQLETLVLMKTLAVYIEGVVASDTMLVSLVDDTAVPPLDVAREIVETKPTTPVSKPAPEQCSSSEPEHGEGFKREKCFREERRRDFGQRGGSFRNRRCKPRESNAAAPSSDVWEESPRPHSRDRDDREHSVETLIRRLNEQQSAAQRTNRGWGEKREFRDGRGDNRGERGDRTRSDFSSDTEDSRQLTDPAPLETPFSPIAPQINAQHEVSVTWITSPKSFYVQIVSLQPIFLEMMHKIPELYKGVKCYAGDIPVDASVLVRFPATGIPYRATVVSVQPFSKFVVQYVDFGNKELVDAKDIWQLDWQLMQLPRMAIHCAMTSVQPVDGEWKTNPETQLCFNVPYQCVFQDVVGEGQYMVYLFEVGVSVVDVFVGEKLAMPADDSSSVALEEEAIDLTVLAGQRIPCRVTHVESHEKFYVQLDLEKADLVEKAVANYDVSLLTPLTQDALTDGVHCTVRHADKIHRAFLADTSDADSVLVVLPDCGETITTSLANLMILPPELSVYYYQSLECCFNNHAAALLPLDQLKTKLTGNKFIAYVDSVEGSRLMTTLYDITTGQKLTIFETDEDAFDKVGTVCARTVYNNNFGSCSVLHLQSLDEIYLQKVADADRAQALLDKLYVFYEEGTPEPLTELEPETLCAAKLSDGNWYRASIVSAAGSDVTVTLLDRGGTATVARHVLKKLDVAFYEPCAQTLRASLGLIAPSDDAINRLSEWTRERVVQATLALGTDGWLASLHLDGRDLSMRLIDEKLATQATEYIYITQPVAETSTQVYISHIDTPGQFWVNMADKVDKIDEIQAKLAADADKYEDLQRELGALCVAKYSADDLWYRAEVLDLDSDIATVRFIDYGNTDILGPGLLKVMPETLRAVEPLAVRSSVNAVPCSGQWSEPAGESFVALVGDTALAVDALIDLKGATTYVELYVNGRNVTDQLVSRGHATRGDPSSCFARHVDSPSYIFLQSESTTQEYVPELAYEEGMLCAKSEDGAWYRAQACQSESATPELQAMKEAWEDAENMPYNQYLYYDNKAKCKEFRELPDDARNKLDELMPNNSTSLVGDNEKQNEVDTIKEVDQDFEDDSSDSSDLDDSLDSTHTVIENKLFEANPDSLNSSGDHEEQPDSPKQDTSSSTLKSSSGTIKTPEIDTSEDSINTDTGYISSNGTKDSPDKANNGTAEITTESGYDKVEIETKELRTETKEETELNVKSNEVDKVETEVKAVD